MNKSYETLEFKLGRDCLEYIVKKYDIKEMRIPYYLCDVIRHTLVKTGCKPIFYHIDDIFLPAENFSKNDFILYPNYFGIFGGNVKFLGKIYPNLIVDNAHAYFDSPSGFACFNAGHKFGKENSILWIKNNNSAPANFPAKSNTERKNAFLKLHAKYLSENLLKIDLDYIISPFVYPLLVKSTQRADDIVKELTKQGKTIYRYWNPLPKNYNEYKFYSRLIPIPLV